MRKGIRTAACALLLIGTVRVAAAPPVTLFVPIRETSATLAEAEETLFAPAGLLRSRRDTNRESVLVGSRALVRGVLGGDLGHTPAFPDLFVAGLRPGDRHLCVTLYSPNGSYIGTGHTQVSEGAARVGTARLQLGTRKADERRDLPALATAALVHLAKDDSDCTGTLLPAGWNAPPKPGAPVTLLVGSGGRSQLLQARDDLASRGEVCVPITGEGLAGQYYGLRCRLVAAAGCPERRIRIETVAAAGGLSTESGGETLAEVQLRSACAAS